MKQVKFDKLIRHAILACLLWGGAGLPFAVSADPAGIGDCQFQFDPTPGIETEGWMGHPCVQPRPGPSPQTNPEPGLTRVVTPEGQFPPVDPFANPPGSNFLMTVYSNMFDFNGDEMPNTLPSTPDNPYNLHDGPVLTRNINPTSPEDDLDRIIAFIERKVAKGKSVNPHSKKIKKAIRILEGDPVGRAYDGFPMLHYNGPKKVKKVMPICEDSGHHHDDDDDDDDHYSLYHDRDDDHGKGKKKRHHKNECKPGDTVIGGNVDVNMIYFNQHIESDTAFVDPSAVLNVPWTVTYRIKILNRGIEDFSPMLSTADRIGENRGPLHVGMDQTFFPMLQEGTEYTIRIKQTKGKYFNLVYTWGWRIHPPRVQVMENALKNPMGITLPEWEKIAFCQGGQFDNDCDPVNSAQDRAYAISQIGDLSPAKRMWNTFNAMKNGGISTEQAAVDLRAAFLDWVDRTKLPAGVEADPDSNLTLLYVNNTMYGSKQGLQGAGSKLGPASFKGISNGSALDWNLRPFNYRVTLLNGDHFLHGYVSADFGGSRGWENHFQYTDPTTALDHEGPHMGPTTIEGRQFTVVDDVVLTGEENIFPINRGGTEEFLEPTPRNLDDPVNGNPQLGSGCFFTFGRNHTWMPAGGPNGFITVPPVAGDGTPSRHVVEIEFNYEPSRRLRIYQFDPLHHDVAVYSLH